MSKEKNHNGGGFMKIEKNIVKEKEKAGGKGEITIEKLLGDNELQNSAGMFARVTLPKGSSIGKHQHIKTTETYFILNGKAKYTDNDEVYDIEKGETVFCKDGDFHGIENAGDEPLIFMALILKC